MRVFNQFAKNLRPSSSVAGFKRGYFISACADFRMDDVTKEIAERVFGELTVDRQYSYRSVGNENEVGSKQVNNLLSFLESNIEKNGKEQLLMLFHNDCAGVKSGIVKVRKGVDSKRPADDQFDYEHHAATQMGALMKNERFRKMVESGKLKVVPGIYDHNPDGSGKDQAHVFEMDYEDGELSLAKILSFPVQGVDLKKGQGR